MNKIKLVVSALVSVILLSGCGGSTSTPQSSFDVNSDIAAIQDAVKVFQDL